MERSDIIVIGLPRGGFVIAEIIAKELSCKLYMLLVKRLRAPYNEEMAIGAVAGDGSSYLNKSLIKDLKISDEYIDNELSYQLEEIQRQADVYDEEKKNSLDEKDNAVNGKTIIIVDDGAATGSTILATITSLRNNYNPKNIIVAVPVSPRDTVNLFRREGIDHVEVIICPTDNKFKSIEQFYQNFDRVSDDKILDVISTLKNK
jgi:predicted phosphoribosyltransferase